MMQAASDIFLDWTPDGDRKRHYYWRQLRDMKGSALVEAMQPLGLRFYARICGWTLPQVVLLGLSPAGLCREPLTSMDETGSGPDHRLAAERRPRGRHR